jgi:hypothetical protein
MKRSPTHRNKHHTHHNPQNDHQTRCPLSGLPLVVRCRRELFRSTRRVRSDIAHVRLDVVELLALLQYERVDVLEDLVQLVDAGLDLPDLSLSFLNELLLVDELLRCQLRRLLLLLKELLSARGADTATTTVSAVAG